MFGFSGHLPIAWLWVLVWFECADQIGDLDLLAREVMLAQDLKVGDIWSFLFLSKAFTSSPMHDPTKTNGTLCHYSKQKHALTFSQILSRPSPLPRQSGRDQIPLQRSMDYPFQKAG